MRPQPKTSADICNEFGLKNTEINFSEDDYKNINNYKLFSQHVRPLITKDNPKIAQAKLVVLLGAKWREFAANNPFKGQNQGQGGDRSEPVSAVVVASAADSPATPQRGKTLFCECECVCVFVLLQSQIYLWCSPFLVRYLLIWPFLNPAIEVFRILSSCVCMCVCVI